MPMIPTGILDGSFAMWIVIHSPDAGTSDKNRPGRDRLIARTVRWRNGPSPTLIAMSWFVPDRPVVPATEPRVPCRPTGTGIAWIVATCAHSDLRAASRFGSLV